jgi:hypothetical protein
MSCLESAAQVGEFVGGFATLAGLIFAFKSVDRWRKDRLDERRGDAAAGALVALARATHRMCGRCELLASTCNVDDDRLAIEAGRQFAELFQRLDKKISEDVMDALHEVLVSTVALLDESETGALRDMQDAANLFQNEMSGFLSRPVSGGPEMKRTLDEITAALGEWRSKFEAIGERGRTALLPIARLRAPQSQKAGEA